MMKRIRNVLFAGLCAVSPSLIAETTPFYQGAVEVTDEPSIPSYDDAASGDHHSHVREDVAGSLEAECVFPYGEIDERYKDLALMPLAHLGKAALSLPAGLIGGVKGTDGEHKYRVLYGVAYGVIDTVDGCIKTALLPLTMPYYLYKAIKKKPVKDVSKKSVFSSYFRAKNGFHSVYKKNTPKRSRA